jgi:ABC-type transporter Mla subunit MlaD
VVGLIAVTLIAIAVIIAFSGLLGVRLPWQGGYEVKAVFESAQSIRSDSPVRIAGVNVGTVTDVQALPSELADSFEAEDAGGEPSATDASTGQAAAVVTMDLKEDALPLKTDATLKLRPRLFLEGNYFIDLEPGSPAAEEIEEGHTFAINQTSYTPQLDQILTTLQGDVRLSLQTFLDQFGNALIEEGGAEGLREFWRTSGPAGKYTSQVNEAFLGTEPGDLSGVIRGLDRVVYGLGRNEQTLQDLVTDFSVVSGSFAAEEIALGEAIERLPGALRAGDTALTALNDSFPQVRAFAREALPGVESTPETLRVATPFITQIRHLMSRSELRGLVGELRPTVPELAELSQETVPLLEEARALSSCFNEVILPWANDEIEAVDPNNIYPHDAAGRVFEETGYVMTGLAGIGRNGDANGQWGRVLGQSGTNLLDLGPEFALVPQAFMGTMPAKGSSAKTQLTDEHPCERQEPPSLQAGLSAAPPSTPLRESALTELSAEDEALFTKLTDRIEALGDVEALADDGDRAEAKRLAERGIKALAELGISGDLNSFLGGDAE